MTYLRYEIFYDFSVDMVQGLRHTTLNVQKHTCHCEERGDEAISPEKSFEPTPRDCFAALAMTAFFEIYA